MQSVLDIINTTEDFSSSNLETKIKDWITKNELSFGKVMGPLRIVIVGDLKGPHLFDILELIGKQECVLRITTAIDTLN